MPRTHAPPPRFLPLLALLLPLGCSSVTVVDPGPEGSCAAGSPSAPAPATALALTDVRTAAFVGETLHVQARIDGADRYLVLAFDGDSAAHVASSPAGMLGPANLVPVMKDRAARLRTDAAGATHIDLVDTTYPAAPFLLAQIDPEAIVDPPDVFSVAGDHLLFSVRPSAEEPRQLAIVDLSDPSSPSSPEIVSMSSFGLYPEARYAASGGAWISWNLPTGDWMQQTDLYAVDASSISHVVDYGYNQEGVHHYGNVVGAATDGTYAVFDPENDSQFLLTSTLPGGDNLAWGYFDIAGPKKLLGVADGIAYLMTASSVRAYDITDIQSPVLLPFEAKVPFLGASPPRLLASSDRLLLVVDGAGLLYAVPRDHSGDVEPLLVFEDAPSAGAPSPACSK